jgi:hypothetical protein
MHAARDGILARSIAVWISIFVSSGNSAFLQVVVKKISIPKTRLPTIKKDFLRINILNPP